MKCWACGVEFDESIQYMACPHRLRYRQGEGLHPTENEVDVTPEGGGRMNEEQEAGQRIIDDIAKIDTTPEGGRHAHVEGRYDLVPPEAIRAIAMVMEEGVKVGREDDNWRKVPVNMQINHAIAHLVAVMMNERDEDHLAHALTRLAMAVAVRKEKK